ncbi:hypothetical protein TNCV_3410621 [Trichonephila clavipes]|nr:hypothetical protein TNCV_3410621 [Trichonephila clavipes]
MRSLRLSLLNNAVGAVLPYRACRQLYKKTPSVVSKSRFVGKRRYKRKTDLKDRVGDADNISPDVFDQSTEGCWSEILVKIWSSETLKEAKEKINPLHHSLNSGSINQGKSAGIFHLV